MYPPYDSLIDAEMAYRREQVSVHFANAAWVRQHRRARKANRVTRRRALRRAQETARLTVTP